MKPRLLLIGVIVLLIFTGCKKEETGKTMIRMQICWDAESGRGVAISKILHEFEKKNPDIKIKLIGGNQDTQKFMAMILSGKPPAVMQTPYEDVKGLGGEGGFIDIGKYFSDYKKNYSETIWEMGQANGKQYGIPWMGHSIQLIYNKTLFDKYEIKHPPKNWKELYETAKKLTLDTNGDGRINQYGIGLVGKQCPDIAWLFDMFLYQNGGELIKKDNGRYKVTLNSSDGVEALKYYIKLVKECAPPDTPSKDGLGVMTDFRNQIVAMEFQGPWGITDIWKNGNPFQVGAVAAPAGKSGTYSEVGPYMLAIPFGIEGEKFDAAIKLIKFLISKKAQDMLVKGERSEDGKYYPFRVPIRKDMADSPYFKEHPEFLPFIEGMSHPSISTPIEAWKKIQVEVFQSVLNQAVIGSITPEKAMKEVETRGNKILSNVKVVK